MNYKGNWKKKAIDDIIIVSIPAFLMMDVPCPTLPQMLEACTAEMGLRKVKPGNYSGGDYGPQANGRPSPTFPGCRRRPTPGAKRPKRAISIGLNRYAGQLFGLCQDRGGLG